MAKQIIKLTESDLRNIIKNSVKKVIREIYDDEEELEHEFYNEFGNQSQYPAYDYMPPLEGELGMTAQYSDEERDARMHDYDPEYFLDGRYNDYRSKMPGNYCTNESRIMRRRRMK